MTTAQSNTAWDMAMSSEKSHREAYAYAEVKIREALAALPEGWKQCSTVDLAAILYSGENGNTKQRIFRSLKTLAMSSLADCWTHGEPVTRYGRQVRPKLWHKPVAKACPHCGGAL